jgi:hypothetical protein
VLPRINGPTLLLRSKWPHDTLRVMSDLAYTPAPLTVHDYRELPEGGPRYQLVDGDLPLIHPQERKVVVYDLRKSETEPANTWLEGDQFECKLLPGLQFEVAKFFLR